MNKISIITITGHTKKQSFELYNRGYNRVFINLIFRFKKKLTGACCDGDFVREKCSFIPTSFGCTLAVSIMQQNTDNIGYRSCRDNII